MNTTPGCWLVVGADGQIGSALGRRLADCGLPVVGTTRRTPAGGLLRLDLAAPPSEWSLPADIAVCYMCAAVTSVEKCERDPAGTRLVNVGCSLELARRVRDRGGHTIFLSTNQVFDGTVPFRTAAAAPCPRTEYGRQKAEMEAELLARGGATVVRLTKVLGPDAALIRGWVNGLLGGRQITAFGDMVLSPVPLGFVAEVLVRAGRTRAVGVVQVSGDRDLSYAEVARRTADRVGAPPDLVRVASYTSLGLPPTMAPAHTTLDTSRLRRDLGLDPPTVGKTLDELIAAAVTANRPSTAA